MKPLSEIFLCGKSENSRILTKDLLSAFLFYLFGAQRVGKFHGIMPILCKSYPSNGARHVLDLYICIKGMNWVKDGLYYYHPINHEIIYIGSIPRSLNEITLIITVNYERMQWRYRNSWSYRDILFEIGHFIGNLQIITSAYGINFFERNDFNKDELKKIIGLKDLEDEVVLVVELER